MALALGVKQLGSEVDKSSPSSTEINNGGVISPLLYTSSWRDDSLIKHRDNFNFTFLTILMFAFLFKKVIENLSLLNAKRLSCSCS
jgi:hypothetical protein